MRKWVGFLGVLGLIVLSTSCFGTDVGQKCKLREDAQKQVKELEGEDVRVAVPSFQCALSYCFATYYDPDNIEFGYCSKLCETVDDCPSATDYQCKIIVNLSQDALPPEYRESLAPLIGKKICMKNPPEAN